MKIGTMKCKKNATSVKKKFCNNTNQRLKFKLYKKVRDHCHFTGKFNVIYIIKYPKKFQ